MLVLDDSGDRKDGHATAHVGHQYPGRYGKVDRGVVTVTTLRADAADVPSAAREPYTTAAHPDNGRADPEFRIKLQIGAELVRQARGAGSCSVG